MKDKSPTEKELPKTSVTSARVKCGKNELKNHICEDVQNDEKFWAQELFDDTFTKN